MRFPLTFNPPFPPPPKKMSGFLPSLGLPHPRHRAPMPTSRVSGSSWPPRGMRGRSWRRTAEVEKRLTPRIHKRRTHWLKWFVCLRGFYLCCVAVVVFVAWCCFPLFCCFCGFVFVCVCVFVLVSSVLFCCFLGKPQHSQCHGYVAFQARVG